MYAPVDTAADDNNDNDDDDNDDNGDYANSVCLSVGRSESPLTGPHFLYTYILCFWNQEYPEFKFYPLVLGPEAQLALCRWTIQLWMGMREVQVEASWL